MTTANGDGIEFNPYLGSIFDEIERIKGSFAFSPTGEKREMRVREEEDIRMEDIPEHLRPSSLLIESTRMMEEFKE